ncbi:MAG: hypothetical protein AB7I18_04825 [Candidatus Berkiella sp.]
MNSKFVMNVTDFFKIINRTQTVIAGFVEPEDQPILTGTYEGKIFIDGVEDRTVKVVGEDIFARSPGVEPTKKRATRTFENIDGLFPLVNIKKIVLVVEIPDATSKGR